RQNQNGIWFSLKSEWVDDKSHLSWSKFVVFTDLGFAWLDSNENLSIGVVSPYAAQVDAIQDILGQKYDKHDGFDVKVKTIVLTYKFL
ncbi:hypothetical protein L195_g009717, partial [Trifolium pratense]